MMLGLTRATVAGPAAAAGLGVTPCLLLASPAPGRDAEAEPPSGKALEGSGGAGHELHIMRKVGAALVVGMKPSGVRHVAYASGDVNVYLSWISMDWRR